MVTAAHRSDYDLCLLGPLRVSVDGREVALGGPRQIAVLARLMVTPDQVVSMDQLIASVWDGVEPNQPHVTIRSYVSNLRRAIEPNRRRRSADSCLASSPPGYRLTIDPLAVDWVRFQRLVDESRDRVVGGNHESAVTTARRALALWRGDPCSGLPMSEVFQAHRLRVTALRQTAVELLYESMLHLGQDGAVAADIEAAIVEDPLRERLTELGMLALYRVGRQSEALALGRRLRERLLEDLGIDPSPAIADIELRILNQDPDLESDPGRAGPFSAITTGPVPAARAGTGSESADDDARLGPAPDRSSGLPIVRNEVRERLADLEGILAGGGVGAIGIVGEQGIGKTTVVRDLTSRLAASGAIVVRATSVSESSAPLWPWTQIVFGLLQREPGPLPALVGDLEGLAGLGRSVAGLIGETTSEPVPTAEVILATTALLDRCARRSPIVIVLEDLHWADRSTVTLLEYAVSTLVDVPVVFVATWREPENEDGPLAAGLRSLSRLADLARLDLRSFDVSEVAQLAKAVGRPLSTEEAAVIHRRTDGNPLFVNELLAESSADVVTGALSPNLRALVTDRIERVHAQAYAVLRAAALFRAPFTAEDLRPLHPSGLDAVDAVLAAAVRGQVLEEADLASGTYRFRHAIIGEVLAADTLSSELRTSHRIIGNHLLATDEAEASYHLAWSTEAKDRALAARIALHVFHRGSRTVELAELDARIRNGLTAAEKLRRSGVGSDWDDLVTDALGFLSWRARVEDRPDDWADNAWRSLQAAIEEVDRLGPDQGKAWTPPPTSPTPLRGAGRDRHLDRPIDRLERAVLNLIGLPAMPAGPGDPSDYAVGPGPVAAELASVIDRLASDSPAALAARIHLLSIEAKGRPGTPARAKAAREAKRQVTAARRRSAGPELAPVLATLVARFGQELEPDDVESMLDEHATMRPGTVSDLLWARYGYPALLSTGRADAALRRAEAALAAADTSGDPLQRAEARFLWTRQLLWAGELEAAEQSIDETAAELAAIDLPQPLPLLRQRRILRTLRGLPGDVAVPPRTDGPAAAPSLVPTSERATPSELAFRLAHLGHLERASEHVSRLAMPERIDDVDLAELALLAAAANLIGHQPAAKVFQQRLLEFPDHLVVRHDGSAILGPISLWASFAARGAGRRREAKRLLDAGIEAIRERGGGVPVQMLYPPESTEDVPIEPQPNLKSADAH